MTTPLRVAAPLGAAALLLTLAPVPLAIARAQGEPPPASAAPTEDSDGPLPSPLALADVVARMRARSLETIARRRGAEAMAERAAAEGLPDDPELMLEWWQQPVDFAMTPLMLSAKQRLPWPGRLQRAREAARTEASAASHEADEVLLEAIAAAARAFFDLAAAEAGIDLNDRLRVVQERLVEATEARYRVGKALQSDVLRAQQEVLVLGNDRIDLERARDDARVRLNALLDRDGDSPLGPTSSRALRLTGVPALPSLVARALETRPELRRAEALVQAARARRGLAETEGRPELSVWGGYMFALRGVDTFTLGVSSSLPLFASRRRHALARGASAEVAAATAALAGARRRVEAEVRAAFLQLETAARHTRLHADRLVPLADLALSSAQASYEAGRADFPAVLEAARAMRMHHQDHIRFLVDYRQRLVDLARAIGAGATEWDGAPVAAARTAATGGAR